MARIPTMWSLLNRLLLAVTAAGAMIYPSSLAISADALQEVAPLQPATPISGSLVICGGGNLPPAVIDRFFEFAGGPNARIVIITTASQLAGTTEVESRFDHWKARKYQSLTYLHTRDRATANDPDFSRCLLECTAIWFAGGNQNLVTEAYRGTLVERRCHELLKRDGVIGGTSAGAAIMSRTMIAGGMTTPSLAPGLGFLPGTIIDQHFAARNRQDRLMQALEANPGHVGLGINECTALVVRGRTLEVVGDSDVAVCLTGTPTKPPRVESLTIDRKGDLIQLSRAAVGRIHVDRRRLKMRHPEVANGTLVIAGSGPTPAEAMIKFISAAGGKEASIVVLTTANDEESDLDRTVSARFLANGAGNVLQMRTQKSTGPVGSKLREALKEATGVWIASSHLNRLVESYLDTPMQALFEDVLTRGGAIGGTSAGAAIQGDYLMCDGLMNDENSENSRQIAEGYERGFGFLPGVAITQTLTRDHYDDMTEFKKSYPNLVGLDIPEATALIVCGTKMEVVGKNQVAVYDRQSDDPQSQRSFEVVKVGEFYDFKHRRVLDPSRLESEPMKQ